MANGVWQRLCEFNANRSGLRARGGNPAAVGEAADARKAHPSYGAGWYASTWELHRGLDVLEGLPADAGPDDALAVYFLAQGVGR